MGYFYSIHVLLRLLIFLLFVSPVISWAEASAIDIDETKFVATVINAIRTDMRAAIHYSDYYLACITNNEKWFDENHDDLLTSREFCSAQMDPIYRKIRERYSKMRLLMGLHQYSHNGDSMPVLKDLPEDSTFQDYKPEKPHYWYQVQKRITHDFTGAVVLPELSTKEQYRAEALRFRDLKGRRKWRLGEATQNELGNTYCATDSYDKFMQVAGYECYKEQYYKMILGDANKKMSALPLLAYVTSSSPSNEELERGVLAIKKNAEDFLGALESKYFNVTEGGSATLKESVDYSINENLDLFFYKEAIKRAIEYPNNSPLTRQKLMAYYEQGLAAVKKRDSKRTYLQMGAMITWGLGCNILLRGLLSKAICELPLGLFASVYFYKVDSRNFDTAVQAAFYRADGARSLGQDVNRLSDLRFNKYLSLAMVPLFSGVPKIIKAIKRSK